MSDEKREFFGTKRVLANTIMFFACLNLSDLDLFVRSLLFFGWVGLEYKILKLFDD